MQGVVYPPPEAAEKEAHVVFLVRHARLRYRHRKATPPLSLRFSRLASESREKAARSSHARCYCMLVLHVITISSTMTNNMSTKMM